VVELSRAKNTAAHYLIGLNMSRLGQILVAHPHHAKESPFYKSVIYIYQDDIVNGVTGLILNKVTDKTVQSICHGNGYDFGDGRPMMRFGGPVNTKALLVLHSDDWASSNTISAGNGLAVSSDNMMYEKIDISPPAYWRTFFGYAGWYPGQIEQNESKMWLTCEANDTIIFEYDGEDQWNQAIKRCSQQMVENYF